MAKARPRALNVDPGWRPAPPELVNLCMPLYERMKNEKWCPVASDGDRMIVDRTSRWDVEWRHYRGGQRKSQQRRVGQGHVRIEHLNSGKVTSINGGSNHNEQKAGADRDIVDDLPPHID